MDENNRTFMQIAPEVLAEKNYTGTRRIYIKDKKVAELKAQLKELSKHVEPILDGLQDTFKKFDATNKAIAEHQAEIKRLQDVLAPDREFYEAEMQKIKPHDDKAKLIKDKLEPLVIKIINEEMGEFEKALTIDEDKETGEIYVEVVDQIEELVTRIRSQKAKK